jgi:hypothetical protein
MSTRACHTAVRMATGGVFSDAEIDDLLNRMADRARRAKAADPTADARAALAKAAGAMTREEIFAALTEKRLRVAAEVARKARRDRLDQLPGDASQRLRAYDVGDERLGRFTGSSVDAEGRARMMSLWGQVQLGLDKMPGLGSRISNFWGVAEKGLDRKIAKELARINGDGSVEPTGDEGALHAARVFAQALDDNRLAQNTQGAWIGKLEGYIARQSHDRLKVAGGFWRELAEVGRRLPANKRAAFDWNAARQASAKRAFRQWRDYILPRLDPKTFDGLEEQDFPENQAVGDREMGQRENAAELAMRGVIDNAADLRERMLYHVWFDIVTGRNEQISGASDLGEFRPPASTARAVSKSRVLHFKDPDAWVDYATKYGRGSLFSTVMGQLERGARNTALMQRWGPAPDAARATEIARLAGEARAQGDPGVATKLYSGRQQADFEALNGRLNVPENLRLAMVARGIRSWEGLTKLGSIVLSKATDLPMTAHAFARVGGTLLGGYDGALRGIARLQGADAAHAAELLDVGARSFAGHIGGQYNATDGTLGWGAWATRLMYRINLFDFANEGVRKGAAEMLARHLGIESDHAWDGLEQGTRETFERFGIDPKAWDLARAGIEPAADGRKYFTLDNLDKIEPADMHAWAGTPKKGRTPQAAEAARAELGLRFRTLIHDFLDNTTSEPRMREQIGLAWGTRAGTPMGEAMRGFSQFRGFLQTILGRHLAPALQGYAGYAPVALMAHFIVAGAIAGYLSMNAKLIVKGQAPRSVIGADPVETAKIWAAALAQGGGLGIYGDYLFGEQNRNGLEFTLSSIAGPAIGDLEQVAQIVRQAAHGGAISPTTGRSQIPGEIVRLGASNIPLVNLWYTRLALDYLVLWRMEEAVSPGFLSRYETRTREDGGGFLVEPSMAGG